MCNYRFVHIFGTFWYVFDVIANTISKVLDPFSACVFILALFQTTDPKITDPKITKGTRYENRNDAWV